jgi:hypothetical protein
MQNPVKVKSIQGEDGPEAEERLYQGLLLLVRIAAEEESNDLAQETENRGTAA